MTEIIYSFATFIVLLSLVAPAARFLIFWYTGAITLNSIKELWVVNTAMFPRKSDNSAHTLKHMNSTNFSGTNKSFLYRAREISTSIAVSVVILGVADLATKHFVGRNLSALMNYFMH